MSVGAGRSQDDVGRIINDEQSGAHHSRGASLQSRLALRVCTAPAVPIDRGSNSCYTRCMRRNPESYAHGPAGTTYRLDNSTILSHHGNGVWKAWDIDTNDLVGSFLVNYYNNSQVPALDGSDAFVRQRGIGRKAMRALVEHYSSLRSSNVGNTSDDAAKAWKSLGCRSLMNSDRGFGRSWYFLDRSMLK